MCRTYIYASPTTKPDIRSAIINRLIQSPEEFGLSRNENFKDDWTKISTRTLAKWSGINDLNEEAIVQKVIIDIKDRLELLKQVPQAIKPILDTFN